MTERSARGSRVPDRRYLNWLAWVWALLPVLVALFWVRRDDLNDASAALNLAGRLTGIGGLSCVLVAAILSRRVPGFDRLFGGLTKLWRTHHVLGVVGFLLLLLHPPLLSLSAAVTSLEAAAHVLLPPTLNWAIVLGWLALLAMMIFMAPSLSFFGEPEYQRWRSLHRLSTVVVLAALAHTFLLSRTISAPWGTLLWIVFAAAALGAIAWHLFARRSGRLRYRVAAVERPANNIVELTLRPEGRHLKYEAGQFVYLTPYDATLSAGNREEHPYTLSSAPSEPCLRIAIKDLGDASRALQQIALGKEVRIEGPYGDFFPRGKPTASELWIAGGIGITPFLGRLRHLAATGASLDAHLIYCVQDESRVHFKAELKALAARVPGIRLTCHFFYREGPLTAGFIAQHCPDFVARGVYICGPEALLQCMRESLRTNGVARRQIVTEEFALL